MTPSVIYSYAAAVLLPHLNRQDRGRLCTVGKLLLNASFAVDSGGPAGADGIG